MKGGIIEERREGNEGSMERNRVYMLANKNNGFHRMEEESFEIDNNR